MKQGIQSFEVCGSTPGSSHLHGAEATLLYLSGELSLRGPRRGRVFHTASLSPVLWIPHSCLGTCFYLFIEDHTLLLCKGLWSHCGPQSQPYQGTVGLTCRLAGHVQSQRSLFSREEKNPGRK